MQFVYGYNFIFIFNSFQMQFFLVHIFQMQFDILFQMYKFF